MNMTNIVTRSILSGLFVVCLIAGFIVLATHICKPALAHTCPNTNSGNESVTSQQLSDRYFTYSPLLMAQAFSQQKKVVLYFYAPWCTTCSSLDAEIAENPSIIPDDVIVLRLLFDLPSEYKVRYGITLPHTFVWIDQSEQAIQQWVGGDSYLLQTYTR